MNSLMVALLIATTPITPPVGPNCHTIVVCDIKKKKPKVVTPVAAPQEEIKQPAPVAPVHPTEPKAVIQDLPETKATPGREAPLGESDLFDDAESGPAPVEEVPMIEIGPRLAFGMGMVGPGTVNALDFAASGLIGLRARFPRVHLGLEIYSALDSGTGIQGLIYVHQGDRLNLHVNAGVMLNGSRLLTDRDVPRDWDITFGNGLEFKVHKNVSLTADYRTLIPSPKYIMDHDSPVYDSNGNQVFGQAGRYLDVPHTIGNALFQGQFLVGVMVHN